MVLLLLLILLTYDYFTYRRCIEDAGKTLFGVFRSPGTQNVPENSWRINFMFLFIYVLPLFFFVKIIYLSFSKGGNLVKDREYSQSLAAWHLLWNSLFFFSGFWPSFPVSHISSLYFWSMLLHYFETQPSFWWLHPDRSNPAVSTFTLIGIKLNTKRIFCCKLC